MNQISLWKAFEMLVINFVADQTKILPIASAEKHFLKAITKYPDNKKLRELFAYRFVKYAETLEVQGKASVTRFEEGLKLLPNSATLKQNLDFAKSEQE